MSVANAFSREYHPELSNQKSKMGSSKMANTGWWFGT